MRTFVRISLLILLDFIVIWLWVKHIDPDPSVSIYSIVLVPTAFIFNLLMAGIAYFINKKYVKIFLMN